LHNTAPSPVGGISNTLRYVIYGTATSYHKSPGWAQLCAARLRHPKCPYRLLLPITLQMCLTIGVVSRNSCDVFHWPQP